MVDSVNGNTYVIRKGDNLTKIAGKYNTTVDALLKLNPQIKHRNRIYIGNTLIISDTKPFQAREDYDSKKLNLGKVTVNGKEVEEKFKSNFFANQNLDAIGNAGDKVVVSLQGGKEAKKNDLNAYSVLNKVVANHLNNNSKIMDENGTKRVQTQFEAVKGTDLYKAMLSVNKDSFDENGDLIQNGKEGNDVQIPTVGKDSIGKTYFVLHDGDEVLYFDSTGKKSEFKEGVIVSDAQDTETKAPAIPKNAQQINAPEEDKKFPTEMSGYNENQLNLGTVFVNGKPVEIKSNANFYRNEVNNFANETLNDGSPSRIDVQLKAGNTMNPKYNDDSADNILKKLLGNNCDKAGIYQNKSNKEALSLLRDTDLYKAFVSADVNGNNFDEGKLKTGENGYNTVQLPALEVDENGTKYYVLHTKDKVLYFNDKGQAVQKNNVS